MAYIEFKEGEKHSGTLTDTADSPDIFKDAGYLLTEHDLVIDIDTISKEPIKQLLTIFNINTQVVWTRRGAHLYFKKPQGFRKAQGICALGFKVEYKHQKNTKAVTVKLDGKQRETENEGIRESLPWFLDSNASYKDLLGMSEGEGRNNALYSAKGSMNNRPGWQTALKFINEHIFAEPLTKEEISTISRFEAVPTGDKGNESAVADFMLSDLDYLKYNDAYYFRERRDEEHISDEDKLIDLIYKMCPGAPTRYVDEVIKQMKYRCRKIPPDTVFRIKLRNGYLWNGEFVPLRIEDFSPYNLNVEYRPDAEPVQVVDDYIAHLTKGEAEYRDLLLEVLGHTLVVSPEFKRLLAKFFIFIGSGGNGKGTLLQIIKGILGTKNVTGMGIKEISDERYLVSMKGKLANLGDDIQDSSIDAKDMKNLKNISTCDYMETRELYKQSRSMYFTTTLIFTSNHIVKSFEKGKSYKRRVLWLPMYTEVKEDGKDPLFITKLTTKESVEYWIRLMVEGYLRLYANHRFTKSRIVDEFNELYHEENNPVMTYVEDLKPEDLMGIPIVEGYNRCAEWCKDNGIEFNQKMFREALLERHGVRTDGQKRITGKMYKVFHKPEKN